MDLRSLAFSIDFNSDEDPIRKMDSAMDEMRDSMLGIQKDADGIGDSIKDSMNTRPIESATNEINNMSKFLDRLGQSQAMQMVDKGFTAIKSSVERVKEKTAEVNQAFQRMKESRIGEKIMPGVEKLGRAIDNVKSKANGLVDGLRSGMESYKSSISSAVKELEKINPSIEKLGKGMMTRVTAPIVALGTASIMTVKKFDDSMSAVKAISGATGEDFDRLRDKAKELGATTAHSASAAADGMNVLATAGWDANQILEGTPHLLSLASASGLELAQVGDIITNTLGQFSLKAEDAGMVADTLAKAASSSQTNVEQMSEAMKYAGGSAATMNMDVAQTSAILGTLANQSVKGSAAGTAFTAMFNDISKAGEAGGLAIGKSKIAVYDASGAMRDMGSIMADVESATKGMTDAQKNQALQSIFGTQSMRGVNAILTEGTEKYKELESAVRDSEGAAADMAAEMENNIGGAFRSLGSAIEGMMIDIGDVFKDDVAKIAEVITGLAGKFGKLPESMKKTIVVAGAIAAAIGPVIFAFSKVIGFGLKIPSMLSGIGSALSILTGPIGLTVVAIAGLIAGLVYLYNTNEDVRDKILGVWNIITGAISGAVEFIKGLWEEHGEAIKSLASSAWEFIQTIITTALDVISFAINIFATVFSAIWENIGGIVSGIISVIVASIKSIIDILTGVINFFVGVFTGDWELAWEGIKQIAVGIFDWFLTVPSAMIDIGKNIIGGLINGIKSMASLAINTVKGIASNIADSVKGFFGIKSPSTLMIEYGGNITEGLGIGMMEETPALDRATATINEMLDVNLSSGSGTVNNASTNYSDHNQRMSPVETSNELTVVPSGNSNVSFSPTIEIKIEGQVTEKEVTDIETKVKNIVDEKMDEFFIKLGMVTST